MSLDSMLRPKRLSEIVGNKTVVGACHSLLKRGDNPPQAFLLTGPSGCGKTTLARCIANELKISERDYVEYDIGNMGGVDNAKILVRKIHNKPWSGKYCLYVLDEVHNASKQFQTALLKSLEEPPPHVIFILCTTDPAKLLPTIRNRCKRFDLKPLSEKEYPELLKRAYDYLGCDPLPDIFQKKIYDISFASPRAILHNVERTVGLGKKEIEALLEKEGGEEVAVIDLCRRILDQRTNRTGRKDMLWREGVRIMQRLQEQGTEPESVRRIMISFFTKVLISGTLDNKNVPVAYFALKAFSENTYELGWTVLYTGLYEFLEGEVE